MEETKTISKKDRKTSARRYNNVNFWFEFINIRKKTNHLKLKMLIEKYWNRGLILTLCRRLCFLSFANNIGKFSFYSIHFSWVQLCSILYGCVSLIRGLYHYFFHVDSVSLFQMHNIFINTYKHNFLNRCVVDSVSSIESFFLSVADTKKKKTSYKINKSFSFWMFTAFFHHRNRTDTSKTDYKRIFFEKPTIGTFNFELVALVKWDSFAIIISFNWY